MLECAWETRKKSWSRSSVVTFVYVAIIVNMNMKLGATVLQLMITVVIGYPGEILQHPETQTTLAGGSKIFVCTGQGDVLWYINDLWLSNSYRMNLTREGFVFTKTVLSGYTYPTANLTMSIPARNDLNGTEVHCRTAGSDTIIVYSNYSYLWIVGPPLTPNVSVELTSWNTMRLSWTAPFTADGFPILRYIVLSTNSSTGQRSRTYVNATNGNESLSIVDTPSNCHSLQFEILAHNSAGNSSSYNISGGFPIAVNEFKVNMSTVYLIEQDKINVLLSFQPPEVCSGTTGVSATYILELMTVSGVVVHRTETQYHDSNTIEETLTVDSCTFYYLNVSVFVPSFPELGTHSNVTEFDTVYTCPTACSNAGAGIYQSSVLKSETDKTMTPTPKSSIALDDDDKAMTPTPKLSITLDDKTMTPRTSRTLEISVVKENCTALIGVSVAMTILLLIVLAGLFGVVAVLSLRRRRITDDNKQPLPSTTHLKPATPLYDVIHANYDCKQNTVLEEEESEGKN